MRLTSAHAEGAGWRFLAFLGLHDASLPGAVITGLVVGLVIVVAAVSYPALIFAGELEVYAPLGVRIGLFSAFLFSLVLALTSSYPGAVGVGQSETAVVLGVVAAAIGGSAAGEQILPTILTAIMLSALATGVFFLVLGTFRLGNLIRFVPFPVMAGFLAGIGWLLVRGALASLLGTSLALAELPRLLEAGLLLRWSPAAAFAVVLYYLQTRWPHPFNLLWVVAGVIGLFWATASLAGMSPAALQAEGWLVGTAASPLSWQPLDQLDALASVDWRALQDRGWQLGSLVVIALIALLLTASSVELVSRRDIDLNRELLAAGFGNLLAGLGGGLPGYHSLSGSSLAARLGTPVRLAGLTSALVCAACLYFGMALVSFVPKLLVGTVLLYTGLSFLIEWLYQTWSRVPTADYAVLVLVFLAVVFIGLVEGVALGVIAGIVLFVINYSRVNVIRSIASGAGLRSNVARPDALRSLLRQHGREIFVLKLQGYIFFATANRLLDRVRARLGDPHEPALRCLVLDFRRVSGLDSSTVVSFAKLTRYAEHASFSVVLTGLAPEMATPLRLAGIEQGQHPAVRVFADLDRGLEWSEAAVLAARDVQPADGAESIEERLRRDLPSGRDVARFMRYLERLSWPPGATLIAQGEESTDLFFVERGQVTVQLRTAEGRTVRLRTMGPGTVVGEAAFYLGLPRSASVIADAETTAYRLTRPAIERMQQQDPGLAALFHGFMARMLAARLLDTTQLLETDIL